MSMSVWSKLTPANIKLEHYELGQVVKLGGEPPICVIPKISKAGDLLDQVSVTIKISDDAKESFQKFVGRTAEKDLCHVLLFWPVEAQLEYWKDFHNRSKINNNKKTQHNSTLAEIAEGKAKCKSPHAEIVEADDDMEAKSAKFWLLWERLLDNSLLNAWQQIVTNYCDTDGYVTRNGVKAPEE